MATSRRIRPTPAPVAASRTEHRGTGFVRTEVKDRTSVYHEEDREVEILREMFADDDPPAHVKVGAGLTINLGNFESLRVDCAVTIPCHRSRIQEAYQLGSDFVSEAISNEQTNWLGSAKPTGKAKKG